MEFGWAAAKEALDWTTRATSLVTTEESSGRDMHPMVRTAEAKKSAMRAGNREGAERPW